MAKAAECILCGFTNANYPEFGVDSVQGVHSTV